MERSVRGLVTPIQANAMTFSQVWVVRYLNNLFMLTANCRKFCNVNCQQLYYCRTYQYFWQIQRLEWSALGVEGMEGCYGKTHERWIRCTHSTVEQTGSDFRFDFLNFFFVENCVSTVLPLNLWVELTGFSDAGDLWKDSYENENFEEEIKCLFDEVTFIEET